MDVWVVYGCDKEGSTAYLYGVYAKEEDAKERSKEVTKWYLNIWTVKAKVW